jgi:hypothetical protein
MDFAGKLVLYSPHPRYGGNTLKKGTKKPPSNGCGNCQDSIKRIYFYIDSLIKKVYF